MTRETSLMLTGNLVNEQLLCCGSGIHVRFTSGKVNQKRVPNLPKYILPDSNKFHLKFLRVLDQLLPGKKGWHVGGRLGVSAWDSVTLGGSGPWAVARGVGAPLVTKLWKSWKSMAWEVQDGIYLGWDSMGFQIPLGLGFWISMDFGFIFRFDTVLVLVSWQFVEF